METDAHSVPINGTITSIAVPEIYILRKGGATILVDSFLRTVIVNDTAVTNLTPKEMTTLLFLVRGVGKLQTKIEILEHVYPIVQKRPGIRIIDTMITRLRQKLGAKHPNAGGIINTVWGLGYKIPSLDQT